MSQILPPLNLLPSAPGVPNTPKIDLNGDVVGTTDNNTVIKIEGNTFENRIYSQEQDGYVLSWNNNNNQIEATSINRPAVWDQPQWWIDPINGNNANDGLTASTAIKTGREYNRRIGNQHLFNRNIIMVIMSDLPDTDMLDFSNVRPVGWDQTDNNPFFFTVYGLDKSVVTGTAISRTFDQLNNIPNGLSCTALGSLNSYILPGRMIKKTSGTNSTDSINWSNGTFTLATSAWLAKDEDGTIARMSFPAYFDDVNFAPSQCNQGTIDNGDTFSIVDLCKVPVIDFPIYGMGMRFMRLNFTQNNSTVSNFNNGTIFIECATNFFLTNIGTNSIKWSNCQVNGPAIFINHGSSAYITQGLIKDCFIGVEGQLDIQNYTLLQGCTTGSSSITTGLSAGISCHTRGFGIFDSPISGIFIPMGQSWQIAGTIYGSGNAGYAIEIDPGGKLYAQEPTVGGKVFCLTGLTGDIKLGGKTSGPAVNPASPWSYTEDRAYTLANLHKSVATGGFNYNIFDPVNPITCITKGNF